MSAMGDLRDRIDMLCAEIEEHEDDLRQLNRELDAAEDSLMELREQEGDDEV